MIFRLKSIRIEKWIDLPTVLVNFSDFTDHPVPLAADVLYGQREEWYGIHTPPPTIAMVNDGWYMTKYEIESIKDKICHSLDMSNLSYL